LSVKSKIEEALNSRKAVIIHSGPGEVEGGHNVEVIRR